LVRRWKAPIFWKTGRQPGLSHVRAKEAVRERAVEPAKTARGGSDTRTYLARPTSSATMQGARLGWRWAAARCIRKEEVSAYPESWPGTGPLATELGICGQIVRNPPVTQGDLATDR
jgi:hypothetical protein